MDHLTLYNKVRTVPEEAKKEIKGGRINGFTDINPMWRIKVLTEQFGPCGIGWYYEIKDRWMERCGEEAAAFVEILLYIKQGEEWSKPIFGTGGSMFAKKERAGINVSDECYKMATTDAISVACKQLGIGADVYWGNDKTKYDAKEKKKEELMSAIVNSLYLQLKRTGVGKKNLLDKYGVADIHEMTLKEYKDAMDKLEEMPDKGTPPPAPKEAIPDEIPEEETFGLPFR